MKKILGLFLLATSLAMGISEHRTGAAAAPIYIDGFVRTSAGATVTGAVVVAWCGDLSHFGGSDTSDARGHFRMVTNSDDCPLGSDLTVTTDLNSDGASDGAAHAPVHTSTTVSITLGSYTSVSVPEFGWVSGVLAAGTALAATISIRHRFGNSKNNC